ncbi:rhodanese-like domain-containing protein [Promicromonospora sp. NPDC090134]|uniref:rhodanese-like domain-containing protein n=1 Tax=Promicromonospora sp. NPDC090134 TaxID=3364408 RepID=UPI00381EA594
MSVRHYLRRPPEVSATEAMRLVGEGALVVDVRREREWRDHHVPGSVHLPLTDLAARAEELPDDRVLIAFCTGGLLSRGAANLLAELGFEAVSLARGLVGWRAAGGELEGERAS